MSHQVILPAGYEATVWTWKPKPLVRQAVCDCGWKGRKRLFTARPVQHPHVPLVPWWRKTYHRRPALVAGLLMWLLPIAAYFSALAHADPASDAYTDKYAPVVCQILDKYPTFAGIEGVVQGIHNDGLSFFQAGEVIGTSVIVDCPQHLDLLNAWVNATLQPNSGISPVAKI